MIYKRLFCFLIRLLKIEPLAPKVFSSLTNLSLKFLASFLAIIKSCNSEN